MGGGKLMMSFPVLSLSLEILPKHAPIIEETSSLIEPRERTNPRGQGSLVSWSSTIHLSCRSNTVSNHHPSLSSLQECTSTFHLRKGRLKHSASCFDTSNSIPVSFLPAPQPQAGLETLVGMRITMESRNLTCSFIVGSLGTSG